MSIETHRLPAADVAYDHRKRKDAIQQTTPVKQHPAVFKHPRVWNQVHTNSILMAALMGLVWIE